MCVEEETLGISNVVIKNYNFQDSLGGPKVSKILVSLQCRESAPNFTPLLQGRVTNAKPTITQHKTKFCAPPQRGKLKFKNHRICTLQGAALAM